MIYAIYIFGGLFIALAGAMMYVFYRSQHFGMFLMGAIYATSGVLAIALPHWWPLVTGFVLVWLMRLLGLEPKIEPPAEAREEPAEPASRVKDNH
jgi:hypothetical protein